MTTTYTNEAGEVVASYTSHQNWKSALDSNGVMTAVEQGHTSRGLDLMSDEFKNLPDGTYKLTLLLATMVLLPPSSPSPMTSASTRRLRFWKA